MGSTKKNSELTVVVPPMGEGIQEVKIINFFKKPGEAINKDEILYEMETDKSVVEIESPYSGNLIEWYVKEGDIVAIGEKIGIIGGQTNSGQIRSQNNKISPTNIERNFSSNELKNTSNILRYLPPRTRRYCLEKGIDIESIPLPSRPLMPKDIDEEIKNGRVQFVNEPIPQIELEYKEVDISTQQKVLNRRFKHSLANVVPASMVARIKLKSLIKANDVLSGNCKDGSASLFQAFAYCVAQSIANFPKFRSALFNSEVLQEFSHVNLGIAVEDKAGELKTAVFPQADKYNFNDFINEIHSNITSVQSSKDQGSQRPNVILTYMGECDVLWGNPLLVEPAVAIIFMSIDKEKNDYAYLSITVDHRVINGMEAVRFLQGLTRMIDDLASL